MVVSTIHKAKGREFVSLRSGHTLRFDNNYLYDINTNTPVAQLSHKMQGELRQWAEKGYSVVSAVIRFIVAWRPKDAPREEKDHAVLFVDLMLKKEYINQG